MHHPNRDEAKPGLTDDELLVLAAHAGLELTATANRLFTVRGQVAQLINFGRAIEREARASAGPDAMLRHLIYAAIVHEGRIKTMADEERAADRVFDMLVRGNHVTREAPAAAEGE